MPSDDVCFVSSTGVLMVKSLSERAPQRLREVGHAGKIGDTARPDPVKHLAPVKSRDAELAERLFDLCAFEFRQIDGSHGVFCLAARWKTC